MTEKKQTIPVPDASQIWRGCSRTLPNLQAQICHEKRLAFCGHVTENTCPPKPSIHVEGILEALEDVLCIIKKKGGGGM